ncbi:MAG: hypothetical protein M4579_001575 [Chaenotheca gracillima]|nr:MAG: hypothetical protein M4579_001575 [Chaenotheca gracillima]
MYARQEVLSSHYPSQLFDQTYDSMMASNQQRSDEPQLRYNDIPAPAPETNEQFYSRYASEQAGPPSYAPSETPARSSREYLQPQRPAPSPHMGSQSDAQRLSSQHSGSRDQRPAPYGAPMSPDPQMSSPQPPDYIAVESPQETLTPSDPRLYPAPLRPRSLSPQPAGRSSKDREGSSRRSAEYEYDSKKGGELPEQYQNLPTHPALRAPSRTSSQSTSDSEDEPPPAYEMPSPSEELTHAWNEPSSRALVLASEGISKPCVVPQISKPMRGSAFSPFARAYAPELGQVGISEKQFLRFIDELNDAFIANAPLQVVNLAGSALGMVPNHWVQLAGVGVSVISTIGTQVISKTRARSYLVKSNEKLFHPSGLHVEICTTKAMTRKVELPTETLTLPPLTGSTSPMTSYHSSSSPSRPQASLIPDPSDENDPRIRRVRAMQGYILPITFDVSAPLPPETLLAKLSLKQSESASKKQIRRMLKSREKSDRKADKRDRKADKRERKGKGKRRDRSDRGFDNGSKKIAEIEQDMRELQLKSELQVMRARNNGMDQDVWKIQDETDKGLSRLERELEQESRHTNMSASQGQWQRDQMSSKADKKEHKIANKLMWIVVTKHHQEKEDDILGMEPGEDMDKD